MPVRSLCRGSRGLCKFSGNWWLVLNRCRWSGNSYSWVGLILVFGGGDTLWQGWLVLLCRVGSDMILVDYHSFWFYFSGTLVLITLSQHFYLHPSHTVSLFANPVWQLGGIYAFAFSIHKTHFCDEPHPCTYFCPIVLWLAYTNRGTRTVFYKRRIENRNSFTCRIVFCVCPSKRAYDNNVNRIRSPGNS